jgi:acetyl-CoA/propionyl-CoA carboxylase biotin carboxyl carrier protein
VLEEKACTGEDGFKVFTNWIETEFRGVTSSPRIEPTDGSLIRSFIEIDGKRHEIGLPAALFSGLAVTPQTAAPQASHEREGAVTAPIPGTFRQWLVDDNATVAEGEIVAVIEAMKMETRVAAPRAGTIKLSAKVGDSVGLGAELGIIV